MVDLRWGVITVIANPDKWCQFALRKLRGSGSAFIPWLAFRDLLSMVFLFFNSETAVVHRRDYFSEPTQISYMRVILRGVRNLFCASAYFICRFLSSEFWFLPISSLFILCRKRGSKDCIGKSRTWQGDCAKVTSQYAGYCNALFLYAYWMKKDSLHSWCKFKHVTGSAASTCFYVNPTSCSLANLCNSTRSYALCAIFICILPLQWDFTTRLFVFLRNFSV